MNWSLWICLGCILIGGLCLEGSLRVTGDSLSTKILHIGLKWTGLFLGILGIAAVYLQVYPKFRKNYMDILDWSIVIFSVIFMPIFEALGMEPLMWTVLILFPCVVVFVIKKALGFRW